MSEVSWQHQRCLQIALDVVEQEHPVSMVHLLDHLIHSGFARSVIIESLAQAWRCDELAWSEGWVFVPALVEASA